MKLLSPSLFLLVFHFSASLHEHWLDYLFTHVISCLAFAIHNCTCFCFIVTLPDAANLSLIGIVLGIRTINRYQDFITFFVTGMQHLDRPGVSFCTRTTYDDNAITNAIEIYDCPRYIVFLLLVVLSFDLWISAPSLMWLFSDF